MTTKKQNDDQILFLIRDVSNRIARMDKRLIRVESERRKYRKEREGKEGSAVDQTVEKIKAAMIKQQFDLYVWIKDKVIYIAITLLIVWLSKFIK